VDLGQQRRLGSAAGLALEHAALDLAADDRGLDEHLGVDPAGRGDGVVEVGPVGDLGDAVRRAGPRGLHEDGQAEPLLVVLTELGAGAQNRVRPDGDALGDGELLGELLVHRGGRREDVGAHVGQAGHLEQSLDGAVLPVRPVEHREDHVDAGQRGDAVDRLADDQVGGGGVGGEHDRVAAGRGDLGKLPVADGQRRGVHAGQDPAALAGDADRQHLVLVRVERPQDASGAHARDRVLGAATSEDDRDTGFPRGRHFLWASR
jgi:hypothetical protein